MKTGPSRKQSNLSHVLGEFPANPSQSREPEGAVISLREPPDMGKAYSSLRELSSLGVGAHLERIIAVTGGKTRRLRSTRHPRSIRRLNGSVKQCLSGLFSGHDPEWTTGESEIIDKFLTVALDHRTGLIAQFNKDQTKKLLDGCAGVVELMKQIFAPTLHKYLRLLLAKLWDPSVPLAWDKLFNNCQEFCDRLILQPEIATCFPRAPPGSPQRADDGLNYLLSFASRFPCLSDDASVLDSRLNTYFNSFHQEYDLVAAFEDLERPGTFKHQLRHSITSYQNPNC